MGNNRRAFTLFELILTIILIAWAFALLLQATGMGLFSAGTEEGDLIAVNLAQEKMEELRNKGYANIADEAKAAVSGFPIFQREVAVTTPQSDLKEVSVNVYWFVKSDEIKTSLVTYVSNI